MKTVAAPGSGATYRVRILSILAAGLFGMFGLISPMSTTRIVMVVPLALQEMVLAVWLIVKGFNSSAIASLSAKTEIN